MIFTILSNFSLEIEFSFSGSIILVHLLIYSLHEILWNLLNFIGILYILMELFNI